MMIYIAAVVFLYAEQRNLLFKPSDAISAPLAYELQNFTDVAIHTKDGLKLNAWYYKPKDAKKAVVYFMGNHDSLKNYINFFKQLTDANIAVLSVCYRGYCGSEGHPTEEGLYADADAALKFLEKDFAVHDIIAIGRSLGSGVATELATKNDLGGLVLVSPYTSIPDVASIIYWYMPIHALVRDRFESINKIAKVKAPILILHGDEDKLIPLSQGIALNNAATSPHTLKIYKGFGHPDMPFDRVGKDVVEFINKQ